MKVTPLEVLEMVQRTCDRHLYDEVFESATVLKHVDAQSRLEWHVYKIPLVFSPFISKRDFCVAGRWAITTDGTIVVVLVSTEHPACPPVKKNVRGTIRFAGYVIKGVAEDEKDGEVRSVASGASIAFASELMKSTSGESITPVVPRTALETLVWDMLSKHAEADVTFIAQLDLALPAAVPEMVTKTVLLKQPQTLGKFRELVEKTKTKLSEEKLKLYNEAIGRYV